MDKAAILQTTENILIFVPPRCHSAKLNEEQKERRM